MGLCCVGLDSLLGASDSWQFDDDGEASFCVDVESKLGARQAGGASFVARRSTG